MQKTIHNEVSAPIDTSKAKYLQLQFREQWSEAERLPEGQNVCYEKLSPNSYREALSTKSK